MTSGDCTTCQVCGKPFKKILIHLGRSESCKRDFPKDLLEKLQSAAYSRKLNQISEMKRRNYDSQKKSEENRKYYKDNKENILSIRREHHESKKTIAKFYEECQFGPIYPCICCKRCLPKRGVKIVQQKFLEFLKENKIEDCIEMNGNLMIDGSFHVCHSCHSNLSKKKMPNLCFKNGLQLANVPDCLQISSLGNQLLAKHLIFLKIRSLPKTGMGKMNDRVSNVDFHLHVFINSKFINIFHFSRLSMFQLLMMMSSRQ